MTIKRLTWRKQLRLAEWWQSVHDEISLHVRGADLMLPSLQLISQRSQASGQTASEVLTIIATLLRQKTHSRKNLSERGKTNLQSQRLYYDICSIAIL